MALRWTLLLALVSCIAAKAPILYEDAKNIIPGEYVVVFKKETTSDGVIKHMKFVQQLPSTSIMGEFDFGGKLMGYGIKANRTVVEKILEDPNLDYIEPNQIYRAVADCVNQETAPWGLVRTVSKANWPPEVYDYDYKADQAGEGVYAYIIDTGIEINHPQFKGRAEWGEDFIDSPSPETDENGHGTHVAGTVMSDGFGLAKKATAVAVRVLDGNGFGSTLGVIQGVDWVAKQAKNKGKVVANMSLGGGKSTSMNSAAAAAVEAGVVMVVAAGNEGWDACLGSPASEPSVITVACSDKSDQLCSFSNYGKCVDIIAPGYNILSTWLNGGTNTISGTSMSSPHVAGVVAKYLSAQSASVTPQDVADWLADSQKGGSMEDRISIPPTAGKATPNKLVYMGCEEGNEDMKTSFDMPVIEQ